MAKTKEKSSIFTKATVVKSAEPKPKNGNGDKKEVALGTELNVCAAIDTLTKSLEAVKDGMSTIVKEKMADEFVKEALQSRRKPTSFRGRASKATASCEIRKRSTRSVLQSEEVTYLAKHGITTETKIVKEAVPERYFFNPKAFQDEKLVQKISDKLDGLKTADGENLIMLQEGKEAVVEQVVEANVLDDVAAKITDSEILREIFQIVSVSALGKFKLEDTSLENVFNILKGAGIKIK